jgi:hypothetical protein
MSDEVRSQRLVGCRAWGGGNYQCAPSIANPHVGATIGYWRPTARRLESGMMCRVGSVQVERSGGVSQ